MLTLTRRTEESVMIGSDIEIKVLKNDRDQVCLGFTAPKNVSIHRKEIYLRIQNQDFCKQQNKQVVGR